MNAKAESWLKVRRDAVVGQSYRARRAGSGPRGPSRAIERRTRATSRSYRSGGPEPGSNCTSIRRGTGQHPVPRHHRTQARRARSRPERAAAAIISRCAFRRDRHPRCNRNDRCSEQGMGEPDRVASRPVRRRLRFRLSGLLCIGARRGGGRDHLPGPAGGSRRRADERALRLQRGRRRRAPLVPGQRRPLRVGRRHPADRRQRGLDRCHAGQGGSERAVGTCPPCARRSASALPRSCTTPRPSISSPPR